jgi:voltage-gated potassium channel
VLEGLDMSTRAAQDRIHVRNWMERLTLFRVIRTIVILAAILVITGGVVVRAVEPETFTSIGLSFWWAVTTVTTVGYGDVVPHSTEGRFVGAVLMLAGVSLIPLITSVAVSILTAKRTQVLHQEQDERLARIEGRLDLLAASQPAAPPSEPAEARPPRGGPS